jgi:hypothetical protein
MIQDVILGAKNKTKKGLFALFFIYLFFFQNRIIYNSILKKKKDRINSKEKSNNKIQLSMETEREGFEPSVRITRTTD